MVKKYPDFERGESASITGRTHIPPRLFKEAARLNRQKDQLMQLLSEMNPLNAKAKSREIAALLDNYIPGIEALMIKLKKSSKASKEMRGGDCGPEEAGGQQQGQRPAPAGTGEKGAGAG